MICSHKQQLQPRHRGLGIDFSSQSPGTGHFVNGNPKPISQITFPAPYLPGFFFFSCNGKTAFLRYFQIVDKLKTEDAHHLNPSQMPPPMLATLLLEGSTDSGTL